MLDFFKKNKVSIGGVVVLVLAAYAYFIYFGGSTAPLTATTPDSAISGDLLTTLGSLHTIKLDNRIFTDPVFVSLSDYGVTLPDLPTGRRNPFAPIGQGGTLASTTQQ